MRRAEEGWARVYRRVWDHPVFKSHQEAAVFVWMMSVAAWRPDRVRTEVGPIMVGVGELVITQREVAEQFGLTRDKLRGLLTRMHDDGMIDCVDARPSSGMFANRKFPPTKVTIRNYMAYQSIDSLAANTAATPPATEQPRRKPVAAQPEAPSEAPAKADWVTPQESPYEPSTSREKSPYTLPIKTEVESAGFEKDQWVTTQAAPYKAPEVPASIPLPNIEEESKTEEGRPKKVRRKAPAQRQEGGVASPSLVVPDEVVVDPGAASAPDVPGDPEPYPPPPPEPSPTAQPDPVVGQVPTVAPTPAKASPEGKKPASCRAKDPKPRPRPRFEAMSDEIRHDFLTWWDAYGKDVRKREASIEYAKVRAGGVDRQVLLDAARVYALSQPQGWRRAAVNWLRAEQWLDSPVEPPKRASPLDWLAKKHGGTIPGLYQGPVPMPGGADEPFTIDGEYLTTWSTE